MSCMKGGFVHRRNEEVRDLFASMLQDVCHDVEVEPRLQTQTGEILSSSTNSMMKRAWMLGREGCGKGGNVHSLM